MGKKRKSYTREFKIEAVRLLESTDKSQNEIERELGIGSSNLSRWKKQFGEDGEEAFPGRGRLTAEEERIRKLEREIEILRQERDILKKAVAIFSKQSK